MASRQPTNTRHIRADWVPHRIAAYVTHRYRPEACILCYLIIHLASDFIVSDMLGAIVPQLGQEKYGGSKNVSEDDALSIDLRSPNHDGRNQRECKGLGR